MADNSYKTKQRAIILNYLKDNSEKAFTVDEIFDFLKAEGKSVGRTTVYRYIDNLSRSGEVRRFLQEGQKSATFQFVEHHEECGEHMHLKCLQCGKLIHLDCEFMSEICSHISLDHGFEVDNSKTTILGLCADCLEKEKNNASH